MSYVELLAQRLVSFGLQDGRDRLRAIEDVLTAIGVELRTGPQINVKTNVIQNSGEKSLIEAVEEMREQRRRVSEQAERPTL